MMQHTTVQALGQARLAELHRQALVSLRFAGGLMVRYGPGVTLLPGLGLVAAGLLLFAHMPSGGPYLAHVLPVMLVLGTGVGLAFPAVTALAMSGATERNIGLASGLINTTVQVAGALGLAVLVSLAASDTSRLHEAGDPPLRALASGYHLAAATGAGLVLAALAVTGGLLVLTRMSPLACITPPAATTPRPRRQTPPRATPAWRTGPTASACRTRGLAVTSEPSGNTHGR